MSTVEKRRRRFQAELFRQLSLHLGPYCTRTFARTDLGQKQIYHLAFLGTPVSRQFVDGAGNAVAVATARRDFGSGENRKCQRSHHGKRTNFDEHSPSIAKTVLRSQRRRTTIEDNIPNLLDNFSSLFFHKGKKIPGIYIISGFAWTPFRILLYHGISRNGRASILDRNRTWRKIESLRLSCLRRNVLIREIVLKTRQTSFDRLKASERVSGTKKLHTHTVL